MLKNSISFLSNFFFFIPCISSPHCLLVPMILFHKTLAHPLWSYQVPLPSDPRSSPLNRTLAFTENPYFCGIFFLFCFVLFFSSNAKLKVLTPKQYFIGNYFQFPMFFYTFHVSFRLLAFPPVFCWVSSDSETYQEKKQSQIISFKKGKIILQQSHILLCN